MSVWFEKIPENMAPKNVMAIIINKTAMFRLHPERQTPIKQRAGIIEAEKIVWFSEVLFVLVYSSLLINNKILSVLYKDIFAVLTYHLREFSGIGSGNPQFRHTFIQAWAIQRRKYAVAQKRGCWQKSVLKQTQLCSYSACFGRCSSHFNTILLWNYKNKIYYQNYYLSYGES